MDSIRQNMGMCPQHNVLFDEYGMILSEITKAPSSRFARVNMEKVCQVIT